MAYGIYLMLGGPTYPYLPLSVPTYRGTPTPPYPCWMASGVYPYPICLVWLGVAPPPTPIVWMAVASEGYPYWMAVAVLPMSYPVGLVGR